VLVTDRGVAESLSASTSDNAEMCVTRRMGGRALLTAGDDPTACIDFFRVPVTPAQTGVDLSPPVVLLPTALVMVRPLRSNCVASDVDELPVQVLEAPDVDQLSATTAFSVEARAQAAGL